MRTARKLSTGIVVAAMMTGCVPHRPADSASPRGSVSTAPSTAEFVSKENGVQLLYPANWKPTSSKDYVLLLLTSDARDVSISVDVPKLPAHIPGMIPLGLVVNGYVDDLKKQHAGVEVGQRTEATIAGAKAQRVRSKWGTQNEDAVLTVHGDRVYIFRFISPVDQESNHRPVFDQILTSVKWN